MLGEVKTVLIVGGGSSGWITAALLVKMCPHLRVSLIEDSDTPTIGVGESTLGSFNHLMEILELEDEYWMPKADATYKTSIDFTDWDGANSRISYPFGGASYLGGKYSWIDWFRVSNQFTQRKDSYPTFSLDSYNMIRSNKLCKSSPCMPNWNFKYDTAYHIDAGMFADFLKRDFCIPKGLIHLVDKVTGVEVCSEGEVSGVHTAGGDTHTADLYVDCTGFKSLLLGQAMGEPIESYGDTLINNKAIALRVPYTDKDSEMEHSTNATALDNGWVWNTPLWSRKGTGYVYSDMFTTPEEAEVEFLEHLRSTGVSDEFLKEAACHHVDISTGFRNNAWVENVVGIGLSYGFIEPLESSGLMLIYENALDMIDVLQSRGFHNIPKIDKAMMNNKAKKFTEYFAGFVASHYAMAPRRSSSYWKYIASIDYNNVYFREDVATVVADKEFRHIDNYMGLPYILFGMGKNPITPKYLNRVYGGGSVHPQEVEVCSKILKEVDARNEHQKKYIRDMPTHYKYLRDNIYLNYKREVS